MEMDSLNDDCLCLIFRHLTLSEQLILTKVCTRFHDVIIDYIWCIQYRQIYTEQPTNRSATAKVLCAFYEVAELKKEEYQEFYTRNVHNIERLSIGNITRQAFSTYLGRHIQRPELTFYFTFKYLRLIELTCLDSNLHDGHMRMITQNCPQLEELEVCSPYVTGKYLNKLRMLRRFSAIGCNLLAEYLNEITDELDHLTYLNVNFGNPNIKTNAINRWSQHINRQLIQYPLPELLNHLRKFEGDSDASRLDEWLHFLLKCGEQVKVLKLVSFEKGTLISALEHFFNCHLPIFPRMQELHILAFLSVSQAFSSTQLHSLYMHGRSPLNEAMELIQRNRKLSSIYIAIHQYKADEFLQFIENVQNLLLDLSDHADIVLYLGETSQQRMPIREALEARFGTDLFEDGSRLKLQGTPLIKMSYIEEIYIEGRDHIEFEFHKEIRKTF